MSTSTNVTSGFNQVVSEFVDAHILQTLVNFLNKDKGCPVTLDELRAALQVTVVPPAQSPMRTPMAGMGGVHPPSLSNFVPMATQPSRATKKNKAPAGAKLCQYIFGKGKNVGKTCGEVFGGVAVEGSDRCKDCIDKGAGKKEKSSSKDSSSSAPVSSSQGVPTNGKAPVP